MTQDWVRHLEGDLRITAAREWARTQRRQRLCERAWMVVAIVALIGFVAFTSFVMEQFLTHLPG